MRKGRWIFKMYENITFETILQRMLDRIPNTLDKRESAIIHDALAPAAMELKLAYIEFDQILNESFADTASRSFLIRRCAERGIIPKESTNAVLLGEFTPTNIDVIGQRFSLGKLNYTVISKIEDGKCQVQCETAGVEGNQYLGTIIPIEYIDGLETAKLTDVLIPGENDESTDSLREKYFSSFGENVFGGNRKDYIEKTKAISGVGGVKITRVWNNDIHPVDLIPNEKVIEWYNSIIQTVPEDASKWLSTIFTAALNKKLTVGGTVLITITDADDFGKASDILIQSVQNKFDPSENVGEGYGLAPIGHVVKVNTVDEVNIDIVTTVTFAADYDWDRLKKDIDSAMDNYMSELKSDWENQENIIVRVSQIETRILQLEGVVDINGTSINGEEGNLQLGKYEIPKFNSISGGDE